MDTGDYCDPMIPILDKIDALDYNMSHKHRGICLILDNENFSPTATSTRNLSKRVGSHVDSKSVAGLFSSLGFQVHIQQDLTFTGIKEILKQVALLDHTDSDCFACVVLTHGDHGHLYAYDTRYAIDFLFVNFLGDRCLTLVGKPKLFFIQACQGNRLDNGVVVSSNDEIDAAHYFKIPTHADFMIAYSTLPGFYSFRNTEKGSWFIRALVEVMSEYAHQFDLMSMMTIVCHRVAYRFSSNAASVEYSGKKQVPCITSMLTRRVYLGPRTSL